MARLDAYQNPVTTDRRDTPYLLDVQNDYIDTLATRVVIPLRRENRFGPRARDLNPTLSVAGEPVVLDTAAMGAVPAALLKKKVGEVRDQAASIQNALDALFGAY